MRYCWYLVPFIFVVAVMINQIRSDKLVVDNADNSSTALSNWRDSFNSGKPKEAMYWANYVMSGIPSTLPSVTYLNFSDEKGLSSNIFNNQVDASDYNYWMGQRALSEAAKQMSQGGDKSKALALFTNIIRSFRITSSVDEDLLLEGYQILAQKSGSPMRVGYMLCTMLHALGYEVAIVFIPAKDLSSIAFFAVECRKGREVWLFDLIHGTATPKSIDECVSADFKKAGWPSSVIEMAPARIYVLPIPAYAYRPINQHLDPDGNDLFGWGGPMRRLEAYRSQVREPFKVSLWSEPFQSVKKTPGFPQNYLKRAGSR